ncbi:molybdenum cofactor synthesis protein cinnamon isoform X2 [Lycorma delicatula]
MHVEKRECVPDDCSRIKDALIKWCDVTDLDIILTTGGTGFADRDVTPEATRQVLDKEAPGIINAMLIKSLDVTPFAMLSRAVSGIRKNTVIINLPGSKNGSAECLDVVIGCLPHAVSLLRDKTDEIKETHSSIHEISGDSTYDCEHTFHKQHSHHHHHHQPNRHSFVGKSQVDVSKVARRPRKQTEYPLTDFDTAVDKVLSQANLIETVKIDLRDEESRIKAIGCVLAETVFANEPFPPFPASIKDGYAVLASDGTGPRKVIGGITAGSLPDLQLNGEKVCVRVNTGASVPQNMNAVVQVEDTELIEEADDGRTEVSVNILSAPVVGQDIRSIGSDIAKGQIVVERETKVTSTELGLFATLGINEICVFKRPRIGILSTGDEINDPWSEEDLQAGGIRDSNKVMLLYLLKEKGFDATDFGIVKDNPNDVLKKIVDALEDVDVLITTGSVSMGERDIIKSILKTDLEANIHFGRVNMKPGKPMTFATCVGNDKREKLVFALPGNPSSAAVTCHVFVLPALRKLSGYPNYKNRFVVVKLKERVILDSRPELKRAVLTLKLDSHSSNSKIPSLDDCNSQIFTHKYEIIARTTGKQVSSRLASLKGANGLLYLPPRSSAKVIIEPGTSVNAYIIGSLKSEFDV